MTHIIPKSTDCTVVGAGVAGALAARRLAEAGLDVLLVEERPAPDVGRKTCGNGVAAPGARAMARYTEPPAGPEVAARVREGAIHLPDGTALSVPQAGIVLNRLVFGQRLLADAVAAGATVLDRCSCLGWGDRRTATIRLRMPDGQEADVSSRLVIDASGYRGVLTRQGGPCYPDGIRRDDVGIGYREIVVLESPLSNPDTGTIFLRPHGTGSGYAWIFPMGGRLANVGMGMTLSQARSDLRRAYHRFLARVPDLEGCRAIQAGSGLLPLRRPPASMVGDRFVAIGDAACQANPLHGGGIAPSVVGAGIAADVGARALERGDATMDALWDCNVRFMRAIGARHAAHGFLRRFLDSLSDRDFSALTQLFSRSDALVKLLTGESATLSIAERMAIAAGSARRPRLLRIAARALRLVRELEDAYTAYPGSPEGLDSWIGRVRYLRNTLLKTARGGQE